MNLGVTLKAAEKAFGPALPGPGEPGATLAAVHYAAGKGKKFAGVLGARGDAVFHVHFPTPIDWNLLTTKKGTPDFVNDLSPSGPQGEQGRERLVAQFLEKYGELQEKRRLKEAAAEKKKNASVLKAQKERLKQEAAQMRQRYLRWVGEREAVVTIDGESLTLRLKITRDKSGKIKMVGVV